MWSGIENEQGEWWTKYFVIINMSPYRTVKIFFNVFLGYIVVDLSVMQTNSGIIKEWVRGIKDSMEVSYGAVWKVAYAAAMRAMLAAIKERRKITAKCVYWKGDTACAWARRRPSKQAGQ